MFFLVITNILDGVSPLLIKKALDQIGAGSEWHEILSTVEFYFLIVAALALTRFSWRNFFGTYHTNAAEDLRRRLFRHLSDMDPNFYSKNQTGELMSLLVNDIQSFRNAIGSGILILVDGFVIVGVILPLMVYLNPDWAWKTLILLPLVPFLIRQVTQMIFKRYKIEQEKLSLLSGFTQETISGIRVLKSFVQEKNRLRGYRKLNLEYESASNHTALPDSLFSPIMELGVATGSVILIFVAAPSLLSGAATIGTFIAFQRYITKMIWPMTAFGLGFSQYQKGMASFERIKTVLLTPSAVQDEGREPLGALQTLEIKNLSYHYPNASGPALKNVNFKIRAGQRTGIVGPVGSGKSTLAHLLLRLLPSESGQVLLNGKAVESYPLKDLREKILLVTQEPLLFSMSVEDNLRLPEAPITDGDIRYRLEQVQILSEIEKLPLGLKTELGERGVNLSGGQKQRLCLARGLLALPELLILDDTLSAVDVNTEEKLIEGLQSWTNGLMIISHRLSVLKTCDQILVFNEGHVEASGSWAEVFEKSPTFRQLCKLQGIS